MTRTLEQRLRSFKSNVKDGAIPCFIGNAAFGYFVAKSKNFDVDDIIFPLASGMLYPPLAMGALSYKDKNSRLSMAQLIEGGAVPAVKYLNTSAIAGYVLGYVGGKLNLI